ncbi:MAG: rod shape-determining protein MreD [Coriobacteriia bacterium]|nr:rod shape-determining protein MreD [Coriobacteriia bacterium]
MNRFWTTVGAILAAIVVQVVLAPHLALFGSIPSFPVLVVITLAIVEGPEAGAVSGFAAGLMLDLLGTSPVGVWALVLVIVGYVAGLLQENLFAEGWLMPFTVAIVAGLLAEFSYLLVLQVLGSGLAFWNSVWTVVLPRGVYNTVLALLFYPWLARLLRSDRSMKSFRRFA